jgi:glycine/D-amino acid oxidase-like deaminating enzyme/nitrite reductase/ring-hydroxylating ferredoxin subunit
VERDNAAGTSIWSKTVSIPAPGILHQDTCTDVCIVGAGIAGLTTAYLLAREGRSVVVIDDGPLGGGQTKNTTAHLSNAIDDRFFEIERLHGENGARLAAESHSAAIDCIEANVRRENIDCDFQRLDGYLLFPPSETELTLERELNAACRAGLPVQRVRRAPLNFFDTGPCLRFPRQAQFHPLKYLLGLADAVQKNGGRIFSGNHVDEIQDGEPAMVHIRDGPTVTAANVIVATNTPINDRFAVHTKQAPYISYVIAARVPRGSVPSALYWDTLDPYHYVRLQRLGDDTPGMNEDLLIVGGEDHKTGQATDQDDRFRRLIKWASEHFPVIGRVEYRWSGQVMETIDGLAFIGRNPGDDHVFIVTGDSGMGMTHGTIGGMLLTDLILGRNNPWTELYDPTRKRLGAAVEFGKENLNVAKQYAGWLTGGDVSSPEDIVRDSGAIIRRGLKKIATFRDADGTVHERSAVCPHLGCLVSWNSASRTWDCPCHGSRFDAYGHVINGPANSDLAPAEKEQVTATK